jgi:hypothetical protein
MYFSTSKLQKEASNISTNLLFERRLPNSDFEFFINKVDFKLLTSKKVLDYYRGLHRHERDSFLYVYNNYKNVTKMALFNYIKTGNTVVDAILSTFIMSFFGILINYLYDNHNNSSTVFNILFIYDLFYKKNCIILEGSRSSSICRFTNTYTISAVYSSRFKALWNYIIENIHQTNSIYQIKESYSTIISEINKKNEAIFMVCQNKTFSIDKNIFITSNIIEDDRSDKDTNNTKTDKIIIYIYSYVYPLNYIIQY